MTPPSGPRPLSCVSYPTEDAVGAGRVLARRVSAVSVEVVVLDGVTRGAALSGMTHGGLQLKVTPPCLICPDETLFEMEGGVKQCLRPSFGLVGDGFSKFSS